MMLQKCGLLVVMLISAGCLSVQGLFAVPNLMVVEADQATPVVEEELENRLNQAIREAVGNGVKLIEDNVLLLMHCRKTSRNFLAGMPDGGDPWIWGSGELNTIPFVNQEEVVLKLTEKLNPGVSAWILGVSYAKNGVYPDGMHAVTLVTFSRNLAYESMEKGLFGFLNQRRQEKAQEPLTWSTLLVNQAKSQLRNFKATRKIKIPYKGLKLYYAYETPDLETIPLELLDRLEQDSIREIGICVVKEKSKRFLAGAFLVSLVGN